MEERYDSQTLQKVTALAQRLQSEHQETLTAGEMEAIGREVGLDSGFIRQALAQVADRATPASTEASRLKEFRSLAKSWGGALGFGALAYFAAAAGGPLEAVAPFLIFAAVWPVAAYLGFLAGRRGAATGVAATLLLCMAPALVRWLMGLGHPELSGLLAVYLGAGSGLGIWLAHQGVKVRGSFFPPEAEPAPPLSRAELVRLLFALQGKLEGQKEHRAFLSVDVVGSSEMKRAGEALAVEYSFGEFRRWAEETVGRCGGRLHSAAGDGIMCLFPEDRDSLRAAALLQNGIAAFNRERNRLPQPFRIRCGLAAGEVAIDPNAAVGELHSPVIDRAAGLQKSGPVGGIALSGELAGTALLELGQVAPLETETGGEPAFCWSPGSALPAG